jgi:hypothetical protein
MGVDIEYLLMLLKDELRDLNEIRIVPTFPSGTRKAPDLPQDYDPNEHQVHANRGVTVRARGREYFFPATWATNSQQDLIWAQVKEIHEFCASA